MAGMPGMEDEEQSTETDQRDLDNERFMGADVPEPVMDDDDD